MTRFYVSPDSIVKDIIRIRGREAHHARDVMRLKVGDEIVVFDGSGYEYVGVISKIDKKDIIAKIKERIKKQVDAFKLTLVQAIPKLNKMDLIVEKSTELGVERIIPVVTTRTVVQVNMAKTDSKIIRWNKLAVEASKQCGRTAVPKIDEIKSFKDSLLYIKDYELAIIPCLQEGAEKMKDIVKGKLAKSAILFIGPEGDFTEEEIKMATSMGARPVSLGKEILRSETAAIAALSVLNYELRW